MISGKIAERRWLKEPTQLQWRVTLPSAIFSWDTLHMQSGKESSIPTFPYKKDDCTSHTKGRFEDTCTSI